jgi:hypothetical protein
VKCKRKNLLAFLDRDDYFTAATGISEIKFRSKNNWSKKRAVSERLRAVDRWSLWQPLTFDHLFFPLFLAKIFQQESRE